MPRKRKKSSINKKPLEFAESPRHLMRFPLLPVFGADNPVTACTIPVYDLDGIVWVQSEFRESVQGSSRQGNARRASGYSVLATERNSTRGPTTRRQKHLESAKRSVATRYKPLNFKTRDAGQSPSKKDDLPVSESPGDVCDLLTHTDEVADSDGISRTEGVHLPDKVCDAACSNSNSPATTDTSHSVTVPTPPPLDNEGESSLQDVSNGRLGTCSSRTCRIRVLGLSMITVSGTEKDFDVDRFPHVIGTPDLQSLPSLEKSASKSTRESTDRHKSGDCVSDGSEGDHSQSLLLQYVASRSVEIDDVQLESGNSSSQSNSFEQSSLQQTCMDFACPEKQTLRSRNDERFVCSSTLEQHRNNALFVACESQKGNVETSEDGQLNSSKVRRSQRLEEKRCQSQEFVQASPMSLTPGSRILVLDTPEARCGLPTRQQQMQFGACACGTKL